MPAVPAWVRNAGLVALAAFDASVNMETVSPTALVLAAVACAALAFRRRFPLTVFALTLPATLVLEVVVAPIAVLYTLAERSRNRRLLAGCAVVSATALALPWPLDGDGFAETGHTWTLIYFGYLLAATLAPVLVGQLVQARRDLKQRLAEIEEAREHERALHAQAVLARERAQLAREMHDVVSHQVSLIAVQAGALQVASKDAPSREAAHSIRTLSVATLDELRHMVTLLRASGSGATELTPQPTLAQLEQLIANSGIDVEFSGVGPTTDMAAPSQRAVYRTVQEALTNVRKHAPGATACIEIRRTGQGTEVTVTNTAPTRPALALPSSQQGLIGLRERAELLGGTFESGPTEDGGYRVRLRLPTHTA
ncbi:sensor histidine kinase [Streptomyces sp. NBC_00620]|uniref:sensor histidine kinase n=1 Tax=Streptomyces sp. NBC_00620 TaxID=2903666 RepID=UPI00224D7A46|nr:histidine kinase [Streptomyces sp. NBC_00620]MCX4973714.1 histidine kinase [Streptomyces sp. NBC_00620]